MALCGKIDSKNATAEWGHPLIHKTRLKLQQTTVGRSARLLSREDQRKIFVVLVIQIGLGILDLMAVAFVGVLGALAVNGVQSRGPGNRVSALLKMVGLADLSFQNQVAILGGLAAFILILRTLLSIFFSRLTMFFLSRRGAIVSARLMKRLLAQPLLVVQERTAQETLYAITYGVASITLGVLSTFVTLVSDGSLLLIMAIGLFVVDPYTAGLTFLIYGLVAYLLYVFMHKRARRLGRENSELTIQGNELILQVLDSYREATVRNRRPYYGEKIAESRMSLANLAAEMNFMPNISKYAIEITMVLSALLISAFQFILQDATHAIATLAVFMTAATRIGPAVLRMQQGLILIKNSLGTANPTLDLIERLATLESEDQKVSPLQLQHVGFNGAISVNDVSLCYPTRENDALSGINLEIKKGDFVALVGPSGAGKTSLADVILGVIKPSSGSVLISGLDPENAIREWPGAIAYVPQDISIVGGTIRENVALGYEDFEMHDELIWEALRKAQLEELVRSYPLQLDEPVGERGTKISGGQRQRLGIARALYTNPLVILFDEATSALDAETEASLSKTINSLRGEMTIVMIAHRLSTIRAADQVVYLEDGKVLANGSFDEVRKKVASFDRQAILMGL
jgi:ABC-type multidrug transport system fused ATPase/permease subunit